MQHHRFAKRTDTAGMVHLPGGTFAMGSDRFYPEEAPVRRVRVDAFRIDRMPVTNDQFGAFVQATGHVTLAERAPDPRDYPGMVPEMAVVGSLVFDMPERQSGASGLHWWSWRAGADWRHPVGPGSSLDGLGDHPVVHVAWADAKAYADWAGKSLPTEAEWEYAARGGLEGADFAWGDQLAPSGAMLANYWQGEFPYVNDLTDSWLRTSPVGSFPPNGYDLFDMIGNVWEWTADWYGIPMQSDCCLPRNPRGVTRHQSIAPDDPAGVPRRVLKGGSHLCAENYCWRFRPAARFPQPIDTTTGHVGFRCVARDQ